jgi:hypothetical protein
VQELAWHTEARQALLSLEAADLQVVVDVLHSVCPATDIYLVLR